MKKNATEKFLRLMKISFAQGIIALTVSGVALAHNDHAQILERPVSLDIREAPLEDVLKQITTITGVRFVYSATLLDLDDRVSMLTRDDNLGNVLHTLFTPRHISFHVYEHEATITLKPGDNDPPDSTLITATNLETPYTTLTVAGRVTDATTKTPIAGVNVLEKGTTNGTTTDADGNYRLETDPNATLVFSFIGYKSQETTVTARTTIDVELIEDIASLDEVVIRAGYWDLRKKEQTGNIARITGADIACTPASNPVQALQGRMAGVFIQQTTGTPGGGFNIQIRGQNSLRNSSTNSGNYPLYIVDGIPFTSSQVGSPSLGNSVTPMANPLNAINPNDIESIEILKDADATAIYGSRGANGVVLITTKKGKSGGTHVDLNVAAGIAHMPRKLDLLTTQQYNTMRREAFRNDNAENMLTPANANVYPDVLMWDTTRYTDWQQELLGSTANTLNAQAMISGGADNTTFLAGGNFYRETSVFPGEFAYERGAGLFNLNHTSNNGKVSFGLSSNFSLATNNLPSLDLTDVAMLLPPVAPPLYDDNGNLNWANSTWANPMAGLRRKYNTRTQNLLANANINWQPLNGLKFKVNLGYTTMQTQQLSTNPIAAANPALATATGSSSFGSGSLNTWIAEPQSEYTTKLGRGTLTALTGITLQQNVHENQTLSAAGFTSDALIENIQSAPTVTVSNASFTQYRYAAAFGRLFYNWKEKYIVNLTGRRDGSTRFGPGRRFATFGAVGAGWLFSEETFVRDALPFLNFGKLRTSYGLTGSDQIGDYQYLNTYSSTQFPYGGTPGLIPNRLVNPDYAWETNRKAEVALELGFLEDRIHTSISRFRNVSANQLVGYPLPRITGQSSIQYNLDATVENKGWEWELQSTIMERPRFSWQVTANLTIPRNTLLEYPNLEASAYATTLEVGKSLQVRKLIHGTGVDTQSGLYTFEDVNANGITLFDTPGDLLALKETNQKWYGGLNNTVQLGGFTLSILFQAVKQTGRNYMASFNQSPGSPFNQPALVMDRWQQPGDETTIQRFTQAYNQGGNAYANAVLADNAIGDASFVRVKNMSASYELPATLLRRVHIRSAKAFALGQNLYTFTNYVGLDPETQSSRVLPPLRTITLGLQVSF